MPAKHYSEALAKLKHIDKDRMRHFLRWDPLIEFNVWQNADNHHVFETFFFNFKSLTQRRALAKWFPRE